MENSTATIATKPKARRSRVSKGLDRLDGNRVHWTHQHGRGRHEQIHLRH